MTYFQSFRDLAAYTDGEIGAHQKASFRPAWAVINDRSYGGPEEKTKAIQKWKNEVIAQLLEWREPITRVQRMNSLLYMGRHYLWQEPWVNLPFQRNRRYDKNYAKIVLNYIGQAVDLHVSSMVAYEPNLTVIPSNDEESDRVAARNNKQLLDYYNYEFKLKTQFQHFHRRKKIHGETFAFMLWDEDAGDYHPKYRELRQMRQDMGEDPDAPIPLMDPESNTQITGDNGEPLFITQQVKTGDLKLCYEFSERVLYPTPESCLWCDVPWLIRLDWKPVDEVKARWPKMAAEIKSDGMYRRYMGPRRSLENKVCVRTLYYPPDKFMDKGYYCVSTESSFLEGGDYPFNHNLLPCIRGTDIDLDYELTGMSFIQWLASLNYALNDSTSMILQNQSLFAYPKYQVPRGAKIRHTDLGDDRGIYEYSGPKGAELMTPNSTAQDTWRWRDALRNEFQTLSGIFPQSRGEPPKGITANVALRMLDEEERKSMKPAIDKHGENVERLGTLMLATLATYRDPTDGMLIKILGKNNERYLKYFDVSNLTKKWEVKLIRSSGLPDSPAARTQTVLDLADRFQGMWTFDEVLEYLDIARPEKLIESATVSRQAAESEVEDLLSGLSVPPPQPFHDILPRYRVYEKAVQSRAFTEAEPTIQQRMLNHIIAAEYLIQLKVKLNPAFAQKVLMEHPNFPMYFPQLRPPANPMMLAEPMMMGGPGAPPLGGIPPEAAGMPMPPAAEAVAPNLPPPVEGVPPAGALP